MSAYSTNLKGAKITKLSSSSPNLPYLPVISPKGSISDDVIQKYLYRMVDYGILKVNPDSSNTVNVVAIHIEQGVTVTTNGSSLCKDMCGYHGYVDITKLTNGATKKLIYSVVAYADDVPTGCCADNVNLPMRTPIIASHDLAEIMVDNALKDNKDPNAPEIADICAWKVGTLYDTVRKVYVEGSSLYSSYLGRCYTGPTFASQNLAMNQAELPDNCFTLPANNTWNYLVDSNFELTNVIGRSSGKLATRFINSKSNLTLIIRSASCQFQLGFDGKLLHC